MCATCNRLDLTPIPTTKLQIAVSVNIRGGPKPVIGTSTELTEAQNPLPHHASWHDTRHLHNLADCVCAGSDGLASLEISLHALATIFKNLYWRRLNVNLVASTAIIVVDGVIRETLVVPDIIFAGVEYRFDAKLSLHLRAWPGQNLTMCTSELCHFLCDESLQCPVFAAASARCCCLSWWWPVPRMYFHIRRWTLSQVYVWHKSIHQTCEWRQSRSRSRLETMRKTQVTRNCEHGHTHILHFFDGLNVTHIVQSVHVHSRNFLNIQTSMKWVCQSHRQTIIHNWFSNPPIWHGNGNMEPPESARTKKRHTHKHTHTIENLQQTHARFGQVSKCWWNT